jgi:hypothetical protein
VRLSHFYCPSNKIFAILRNFYVSRLMHSGRHSGGSSRVQGPQGLYLGYSCLQMRVRPLGPRWWPEQSVDTFASLHPHSHKNLFIFPSLFYHPPRHPPIVSLLVNLIRSPIKFGLERSATRRLSNVRRLMRAPRIPF